MNPTVDLVIDSATNEHAIELVTDKGRVPLSHAEAAKLCADIATTLAFSISPAEIADQRSPAAEEVEEYEEEEATAEEAEDLRPLTWHRVETGRYETDMDGTPVKAFKGRRGWDVRVGNKKVNEAPISTKGAAYEFVERLRVSA